MSCVRECHSVCAKLGIFNGFRFTTHHMLVEGEGNENFARKGGVENSSQRPGVGVKVDFSGQRVWAWILNRSLTSTPIPYLLLIAVI